MTFRSRPLLDLAHESPCQASFAHDCTEYQGVEPAHSDQQIWGRGHGHKSHDFGHAAMCHTAHMMLDTFEREVKQTEWLKAHVKTMVWYWTNGFLTINKRARAA
jgi:hypothetical protein